MRLAGICFMRLTLLSCCSVFNGMQQEGNRHEMWLGRDPGTFS